MLTRIIAIASLIVLPFGTILWWRSYEEPHWRRYDVTLYRSLWVHLQKGTCRLELLTMPTKVASRTRFIAAEPENPPATPSLFMSTESQGPYHWVRMAFPLWAGAVMPACIATGAFLLGPCRRWRRLRNGWCVFCGYDLQGSRAGRCSECGTRFRLIGGRLLPVE